MKTLFTSAAAMAALFAGAARADLTPYSVTTTTGYVEGGDNPAYYDKTINTFGVVTGGLGATAWAVGAPGGAVFAAAPDYSTVAGSSLLYDAEVLGPAGESVTVGIQYRLYVKNLAAGYYHNASAEVYLAGADDHLYSANYSTGVYDSCSGVCSSPGYMSTVVTTGTPFLIAITAQAEGAEAYADPKLVIDPTWARNNLTLARQLSLSFSSGVTNAVGNFSLGVPEPATWSMMLVGLAMLGGGLRARARGMAVV